MCFELVSVEIIIKIHEKNIKYFEKYRIWYTVNLMKHRHVWNHRDTLVFRLNINFIEITIKITRATPPFPRRVLCTSQTSHSGATNNQGLDDGYPPTLNR